MYVHAFGKVTRVVYDASKGLTDINVELTATADAGEPEVYADVPVMISGSYDQAGFDGVLETAVRGALAENGVSLEPGRLLIVGPRVV